MTDLKTLPVDHPLRNTPLAEIKALNKWACGTGGWKPVLPHWGIAKKTFNDLGPAWTESTDWSAQQ